MNRKSLTPQEKKIRAYVNECRNTYGENDKSSRKGIKDRKRWVNRAYRRATKIVTASIESDTDTIESRIQEVVRKQWKKSPDTLLMIQLDSTRSDSARTRFRPITSEVRAEALKRIRQSRGMLALLPYRGAVPDSPWKGVDDNEFR